VLLELTVMRFAWTFNTDVASYNLAGVIWVIGWCMILMSLLVHLPLAVVGAIGVAIIVGHNALDFVLPAGPATADGEPGWLWRVLYAGGPFTIGDGGPRLAVLYSIVPWIGVMPAGYALGPVLRMDAECRTRIYLTLGLGAVAAFLVLRWFNLYGKPHPWGGPESQLPPLRYRRAVQLNGHCGHLEIGPLDHAAHASTLRVEICETLLPVADALLARIRRFLNLDAHPHPIESHPGGGTLTLTARPPTCNRLPAHPDLSRG
jgi:hypothetical protein